MENCVFCKIIKGEIPCYKLYEDNYTLSFLDISNDGEGHALVIPKQHVNDIVACDEQTLVHVMKTVKKISAHYLENCDFDGVNVFNNCKESAGQTVMHLHFHILPRKNGDVIEKWNIDGKHGKKLEDLQKLYKITE